MTRPNKFTLEEQIVAAATGREPNRELIQCNRTPSFQEAVRRLEACRPVIEMIDRMEDIDDLLDGRTIDRALAAFGLPTSLDRTIDRMTEELEALKKKRQELLK